MTDGPVGGPFAASEASGAVVLCDKPAGSTSHDAVAALRRQLGRGVKVGHAGTLDPFATGLLLLLVGRATRLQRFFMALPKTYQCVARFGWVSDTGDVDGSLTETGRLPSEDLTLPTGVLRQRPPAYSAVKIDGRRAYARARAGEEVVVPERSVHVYRFQELWREPERRGFEIECGSGTYIRSLVAELGDAYCETLRRTRIGPFDVSDAGERLVPLDAALGAFMPAVSLDAEAARGASHGRPVTGAASGPVRLLGPDGGLIAIAEPRDDGLLKPIVGLCQ
ncbi:MAG TPA: tRNA pseudouridine(55) synthase TruB [Solirubrobacteraceae bacterium]|nr:tRNA pseudouridine(55) synthase TruB [Solirubrobacteraceae bacterium]